MLLVLPVGMPEGRAGEGEARVVTHRPLQPPAVDRPERDNGNEHGGEHEDAEDHHSPGNEARPTGRQDRIRTRKGNGAGVPPGPGVGNAAFDPAARAVPVGVDPEK